MQLLNMGLTFMIFIHEAMIYPSLAKLRHLQTILLKRQFFRVWKSMRFILNNIASSWCLIFLNRKTGALQSIEGKLSESTLPDFHPKALFKELILFYYEIASSMPKTFFSWTNLVRVMNFLNFHTTSPLTSFQIDWYIKLLSIVVLTLHIIWTWMFRIKCQRTMYQPR